MKGKALNSNEREFTPAERELCQPWKQPIWDAVMRRMEKHESLTAMEIVDEIGAPEEHRRILGHLVLNLLCLLEERGNAFMLPINEREIYGKK